LRSGGRLEYCDGNQKRSRRHDGCKRFHSAERLSGGFGIEDGQEAILEARPMGQRHTRQGRPSRHIQGARHFQKIVSVVRGAGSRIQHHVITGPLTFLSQLSGRQPNQGIPPVNGADELCHPLRQAVIAPNVTELVK
jgi:hypothetical protein